MWSGLKAFYCISQTWFSWCQCSKTSHLTSFQSQPLLGLLFVMSFSFIAQFNHNIPHPTWSEPTSSSLAYCLVFSYTVLLTTHLYRATWVHWGPSHTCSDWFTMLLIIGLLEPWRWRQCVPPNFRNHSPISGTTHQSDTASQCRRNSNYITPWLIYECHSCP